MAASAYQHMRTLEPAVMTVAAPQKTTNVMEWAPVLEFHTTAQRQPRASPDIAKMESHVFRYMRLTIPFVVPRLAYARNPVHAMVLEPANQRLRSRMAPSVGVLRIARVTYRTHAKAVSVLLTMYLQARHALHPQASVF